MNKQQILADHYLEVVREYERSNDPMVLYWALKHSHAETMTLLGQLESLREETKALGLNLTVAKDILDQALDVVYTPTQDICFVARSVTFPDVKKEGKLVRGNHRDTSGEVVGYRARMRRVKEKLTTDMLGDVNTVLEFARKAFTKKALTRKE